MSFLEERLWADFKMHVSVFDYTRCMMILDLIERLREVETKR